MRRLTIGRGRECDVRISDHTDMVSRKQAVLAVTPLGKMTLYDTSRNGTFVNGVRLEKPNGYPVTRKDQVNFSHIVDLDWSAVKDPYRKIKIWLGVITAVAVAMVVCLLLMADRTVKADATAEGNAATVTAAKDSVKSPEPATAAEPVKNVEIAGEVTTAQATARQTTAPKSKSTRGKHRKQENKAKEKPVADIESSGAQLMEDHPEPSESPLLKKAVQDK